MRTVVLMLCGVSILCFAPAVWAVDTTPANQEGNTARSPDVGVNPLAGCWRLKKAKYRKGGVLVKVTGFPINHNHWVKIIDKDRKVVAEKIIRPDDPQRKKFRFKNIDCDGSPHKVRAYGEHCDYKKKVKEVCGQ